MSDTVLILGASGKIGSHAAIAFKSAGWNVRKYDRKSGDMIAAAEGADVIVNGLNPPNYQNWAKLIPAITKQVIAAAKSSGASVIIPGNVYNFGNHPGVWSEQTPQDACSRKGKIRVEMEREYRESGVPTIVLRAGNFIDPLSDTDVMGLVFLRAISKGKITAAGRPDVTQVYCYLPDWARAAVMLANKRDTLQRFEDIPFPGHAFTTTELRDTLQHALKRDIKIVGFPWFIMKLASPVWELARELTEMRYLWNTDHRLDGGKIVQLLPDFTPTDLNTVMFAGLPADINPNQPMPRSKLTTVS